MAVQILDQRADPATTQPEVQSSYSSQEPAENGDCASFAELSAVYGERALAEAQDRLLAVLDFKVLKPKSVQSHGLRIPGQAVERITKNAGVSLGTLWRWYRLYRSAYAATSGNIHVKAKAGFEALIPRTQGKTLDPSNDRRYKTDEGLRLTISGLYTRRHRPSITKVWRKLIAQCPRCKEHTLDPQVRGYKGKYRLHSCPECGFEISYSTVRRIIKTIPPSVRILGREGAKAFNARHGIYIPRSYADLRNREIFCGDHHEFDLFVHTRSGKLIRPWISAWLDLKT